MIKIFASLLLCALALNSSATTVMFPVQSITGLANNQPVIVTPVSYPLRNGTNLVALRAQTLQPTNGVARGNLIPWNYTLKIDGWPRTLTFGVNDTTNVVSVLDLITNGLVSYSPVRVGGWATNVDNTGGTNVNLSGKFTATDGYYVSSVSYPVIDSQAQARFISISNWNGYFVLDPLGNVNIQGKISFGQYGYLEAANGNLGINSDVTIVGSLYGAFLDGSSITRGTVAAQYLPTITNQINSVSGVITNGGVVWFYLKTNGVPAITGPSGSLCSTTNGQLFVRSNTVWLLK